MVVIVAARATYIPIKERRAKRSEARIDVSRLGAVNTEQLNLLRRTRGKQVALT